MPVTHELYMRRCLELASQGRGHVAPNPMVGAVLVHNDRIIGEGYHATYGQAHAEVNCINSVSPDDAGLIASSTIYVSLEPCAHFGKTPPCTDLIIQNKISRVVIGCTDPFEKVNGKGIGRLRKAGVEVISGVLQDECIALNKRFLRFYTDYRPYIILKWAQTANGITGTGTAERLMITDAATNRLVHKWRSEETAILIGTNTALYDNPSLDNRLWTGPKPVRMVLDMGLRLPASLKIFDLQQPTIVFNTKKEGKENNLRYFRLDTKPNVVKQLLDACYELQVQSVLVEGGARLLQSFIDAGSWDECRIITNTAMNAEEGVMAPVLPSVNPYKEEKIGSDLVRYYTHPLINKTQ